MKKYKKLTFALVICIVGGYFILGYISSFVGWYGYKKWRYRVATQSVSESQRRNVFVKSLHYRVDNFSGNLPDFQPYIEKGFKYGRHSSEETKELEKTNFPYQLSFNYRPTENITVFIRKTELEKFDSSNKSWGYLKEPMLNDTVTLEIHGEGISSGVIKVWY